MLGSTKKERVIAGMLIFGVILAIGTFFFFRYMITRSFPETTGEILANGINAPVTVDRDGYGVPLIRAGSEHDLMFALGFVHAQDRLWQMDVGRRAGEGRLSEIFGNPTLPFDKMFRIIGIDLIARDIEQSLSEESRNRLEWYAEGVNFFMEEHEGRLPLEFDLLLYEPEEWSIRHSILIAQMMAWELNLSWWTDMTFGSIMNRVGLVKGAELLPYDDDMPTTVPEEVWQSLTAAGDDFLTVSQDYRRFLGVRGISSGSNAWVVSPGKSASGDVILANDTHLHLQLPSKWYEAHLKAPGYDVGGMSIPGVPGIVVGRNSDIAWGVTNMMADESDFYIEQIDTADTASYWYNGGLRPLRFRTEEIHVKDEPVVEITVRSTHHGPVVSDIQTPLQKGTSKYVTTMRWTGTEVSDRIDAFNRINRARDWDEFLEGVRRFSGPGQNFVYGDKEGNIGYWCGATIPVRGGRKGILPVPGWDPAFEWRGFVPFERLPHSYNPPEGFIGSANNRMIDNRYPFYIGDLWEPSSRIRRIRQVLERRDLFSVTDFERLQNDLFSFNAMELTPIILDACADTVPGLPEQALIREYLWNWNFEHAKDDIASAIFQQWFARMIWNIYADELGEDLLHDFVLLGNIPIRVTRRLIEQGTSPWFDDISTVRVETRKEIVLKSLREAILQLGERFGSDTKDWRWGELHTLTLQHPFGLVKPLDNVFNRGPFITGGGPTVLVSGEYSYNDPFAVTVASSFRMVYDFSRPDEMRMILPSGQSGQAFHPNYDDQTQLWLNGAYRTFHGGSDTLLPGNDRLVIRPQNEY